MAAVGTQGPTLGYTGERHAVGSPLRCAHFQTGPWVTLGFPSIGNRQHGACDGRLPERLEQEAELVDPLWVNLIRVRDVEAHKRIIALGMKIPLNRGVFL